MSDIRIVIVGKIDKADWEHNFALVDEAIDLLGSKLDLSQKAAASGIASLNSDSKVIQVALNAERINGKTEEEFGQLFVLFSTKGVANGIAELDGTGKLKASQIPDSVTAGLTYKGSWDADTDTPTIPAAAGGNEGWFYVVNVAGTTDIDGINTWAVGDWIVSNGVAWEKIPVMVAPVLSVAGKTGDVVLLMADIGDLAAALALKQTIGAENHTIALSDWNDINTAGDFHVAEVAGITNGMDGQNGPALITSKKAGALFHITVAIVNNGNVYSRTNDGAWSAWTQLN